ncbi:type II toxin-antitoxin system VapB family antitoxin [Salinibacterium sp.]|uniref:type II toxin-antitoxin system VapB family antitoxin n=1 Tax=Salinibacterium sp. TaxID=1915057 RepID=UPI00286C4A05|nr:type II toxin-antitoxin system VapB family antitoxin [Salinibacterium sp.]
MEARLPAPQRGAAAARRLRTFTWGARHFDWDSVDSGGSHAAGLYAEATVRIAIIVNDEPIQRAAELTGREEKSALVRLGLEALIERESAHRLVLLGGSDPAASSSPRRRTAPP